MTERARLVLHCTVCLALLLIATIARADDAKDRQLAERLFRAGEKAYAAQNFEAAATNFDEAYKILPLPEIAFSAAQAFRRQYRIDPKVDYAKHAVEHYHHYLDKVKQGGRVGVAADALGEMQRELDKLTAAGAQITAEVTHTRLGVTPILGTEKRGAKMSEIADLPDATAMKVVVTIDGQQHPAFQLIDVAPGLHKVRVEAEGYLPAEKTENVLEGASPVAELALQPEPARVAIKTERGARIRVDGRLIGAAPLAPFELPAGKHLVAIVRTGRESVAREIDVARGQSLAFDQPLQPTARRRVVPFVFAGAVGLGAFAVAGVIYAIKLDGDASDQLSAIERGDQQPNAIDNYNRTTSRRGQILTGTLITGGGAALVGVIAGALFWLDHPSGDGIRVTVSGSGAGVAFGRRFYPPETGSGSGTPAGTPTCDVTTGSRQLTNMGENASRA